MNPGHPLRRSVRAGAIGALAMLAPSCFYPAITASNGDPGGTPPDAGFNDLDSSIAGILATSAARDIPCPRSDLSLAAVGGYTNASAFTVEGCGQRVTYMFNRMLCLSAGLVPAAPCKLVLIARLPIGAAPAPRATTVPPGVPPPSSSSTSAIKAGP